MQNSSKPNNFFVAHGSVDPATKLKTIASDEPGHREPGWQVRDRLRREGNPSRPKRLMIDIAKKSEFIPDWKLIAINPLPYKITTLLLCKIIALLL